MANKKLKTHRGAAKRFRKTGTGNFKRKKAYARHILTKKSTKVKRELRGTTLIAECDVAAIKQMLPHS